MGTLRFRCIFGVTPFGRLASLIAQSRWCGYAAPSLILDAFALSPDDPNLKDYWRKRSEMKAKSELIKSRQKIAQKQKYVCPVCGESLLNDEELHLHHKKPKSQGGRDNYGNLQLVHLYCHQQIHSGTVSSL